MWLRCNILLIFLFCCSCSSKDSSGKDFENVSGGDYYELSRHELSDLKLSSLNDDGEAAFKIYLHLAMGGGADGVVDPSARYWLNVSADKGFRDAIQHRIVENLNIGEKESCSFAIKELESLSGDDRIYIFSTVNDRSIDRCRLKIKSKY